MVLLILTSFCKECICNIIKYTTGLKKFHKLIYKLVRLIEQLSGRVAIYSWPHMYTLIITASIINTNKIELLCNKKYGN